jgi:formylglycine-generating enzyme required for sulfatase activity
MNDPVTIGLVVVVTGVLTAVLVLIFRTANRLQERLTAFFGNRHSGPAERPVAAPVAQPSQSAEELELAEVLTRAGPEGARRWLKEELGGRDTLRLRRVLELLPGLGEEYSRPLSAVILRLAREGADLGVRTRALLNLGRLQVPFDAEVRQVLEEARREREPALKNAAAWAWCELGRPEDLGLVKVPAGNFLMGSGEEKYEILSERPQHTLFLPAFYIGRYPVTVKAFSEFLSSSGHKLEKEDRFREGNQHEDHPAVKVSWAGAVEYARWHGMSLPSEAEWEKAARGTDGRRHPWGNEWKPGHANTLENWPSRRKATTTPVGSFSPQGDSPYGCGDMAGNVWEWTRCVDGPYPYDPADGREDFRGSLKGWQMVRGGALDNDSRHARCAVRFCDDFRDPPKYVGFRVVLIPYPL